MTVTTDKGFRMCRANVGVKEGNWFWEARIQTAAGSDADGPHVRIGWARREGKYSDTPLITLTSKSQNSLLKCTGGL